jgi:hypothetical protein
MDGLRAGGPRVRLRPPSEDDLLLIEGLLAAGPAGEMLVITPRDEDRPIGAIQYRSDEPSRGWVTIDHVALAEGSRRWGLGQDAVRLLEDDLVRERRVRHFKTAIDVRQGLALYLWLRLGYHPLNFTHDASGREALAMVRDAD